MHDYKKLNLKLRALAVFGGVRDDAAVRALIVLFDADNMDDKISAYATFTASLYEKGDNWTAYLHALVMNDENLYVTRRARNEDIPQSIEACVRKELEVLQELSCLRSEDVQAWIGYDGYLPEWKTSAAYIPADYMVYMESASRRGFGVFAQHNVFTAENGSIVPVRFADTIGLDDLKGYESQRQMVVDNTLTLLAGKPAADALLYGDAGTGKSSTIKAVANAYFGDGLRLIEMNKFEFMHIPKIVSELAKSPLKFILFIDDLSFVQENDVYNLLKAMLQGSVFQKPQNIVIYATSNRRHLVKETFSERSGDDVHRNETIQELISLSQRFGLTVGFFKPNKKKYLEIVHALKTEYGIEMDDAALEIEAERFAAMGRTPRVARQLMAYLAQKQYRLERNGSGD